MSLRLALFLIRALAARVPATARDRWRHEWEAELREHAAIRGASRPRPLRRSLAALADVRALRSLAGTYRPISLDSLPGDPIMQGLLRDFRYAGRSLIRTPGLTLALIAVLALGIAANTAAFTFANDLLWRTLPGDAPERLVRIYNGYEQGFQWGSISFPAYEEYASLDEFDAMIGEAYLPLGIDIDGSAERIWGSVVTAGYFDLLRVAPAAGRFFAAADSSIPGRAPWVVISEGFWQRRYGADPDVVGATLEINGYPLTLVGVAPDGFYGTQTGAGPEVWFPVAMQPAVLPGPDWMESQRVRQLWVVGRMAPDVTVDAAQAGLAARLASLKARHPEEYESLIALNILPEVEGGFHPYYRAPFVQFFTLLMLVVGMVLLVACTNAAGLLIARGAARGREIAVRQAVGAGRWRLTRQLFAESLLVTALAAIAGILLSVVAVRLVAGFQPPTDIPLTFGLTIDTRVLTFSLAVSMAAAVLFGLLPALKASRRDVAEALKSRGNTDIGSSRLRSALVVGQVALSAALLIGASLFLRSLGNATRIDLGFEPSGLQLGSIDLAPRGYDADSGTELYRELLRRLRDEPSIEAVALGSRVPFGLDPSPARVSPEHFVPGPDGGLPTVEYNLVSPGFLATSGMRLVAGRDFESTDDADSRPVALVSARLAADFWPGERAVGKRLVAFERLWEVIGVAADAKFRTLTDETLPHFYLPLLQQFSSEATVYARGHAAAQLEPLLRRHMQSLDGSVPLFGIKRMEEQVGVALLPARMSAAVLGAFGALTLALAAIGLYGVLAYAVEQRRPELGVRMALGADRSRVVALMVGQGVRLTATGVAIGLAIGFALSRLLVGLLYGISPNDVASYLVPAGVLSATALLASLLPARRAAAVDPVVALRQD